MGNVVKKLEFDCVNRIKYERRENFEDSLFSDVYDKAAGLVTLIVKENIRIADEDSLDDSFCTEERFNNNISFWGERGMGKSSAMLSFALFLKKYDHKIEDRFHLKVKQCPKFYVLPRIDAAMLVKGEYLLDIILAKMWTDFEEKHDIGLMQDSKLNETKKYFENVKKSYELYRKTISGQEKYEMTSVRQLKELSKCLNLKEDFKRLVNSFLDCMLGYKAQINFLVLTIDDLDVVIDDVNNILEQVRLFLSVPNVIVLVTADYGRLFMDCNKSFFSRLYCKENEDYGDIKQVRSYSGKYLAKIFPGNMRVHMPRINVAGGVDYNVKLPEGSKFLNDEQNEFDEKRLLFIMLAKYTKIMMYPFDSHIHLLQKTSIRGIVNELYELEKMNDMGEAERFEMACLWIQTALIEEGRTHMDTWEYHYAQKIMEGYTINETVAEILSVREDNMRERNIQHGNKDDMGRYGEKPGLLWEKREQDTYGQNLRSLVKLIEGTRFGYREFARFALVFYSVQLAKLLWERPKGKDFAALYVKNIFYPFMEELAKKRGDGQEKPELDKMPSSKLEIEFPVSGDGLEKPILQYLIDNKSLIYNKFKVANLCDWNLWDGKDVESAYVLYRATEEETKQPEDFSGSNLDGTTEESKKGIRLQAFAEASVVSIEILLWNALSYEEHLKGFCRNIYEALFAWRKRKLDQAEEKGEAGKEEAGKDKAAGKIKETEELNEDIMKEEIDNLLEDPVFRLKEYREWKKSIQKDGKVDIDCLLPWQSAEVMLHLAEEIGSVHQLITDIDVDKRIMIVQERQLDRVIEEMKKIEDYYEPLFATKERYSEILKDYKKRMDPYNIEIGQSDPDIGQRPAV